MGSKCNGSTTGKTAQDSKPTTVFKWKCCNCSYTNDEDMSSVGLSGTFKAGNGTTDRRLVRDSYPRGHIRLKNRYSTWNVRQGREWKSQNSHFNMLI